MWKSTPSEQQWTENSYSFILFFKIVILYPYGLKIATLSSKKLGDSYEGTLKNNYLYNDKELFDDADLNWYDYGFRNYDPQIGRFTQLDPLTFSYPFYTPYQFAGDEPIANVDVDGLEPAPATVIRFMKGIEKAGASNISVKLIQGGKYAGMWSVAWGQAGQAFAHVFKTTGTVTNAVGRGVGLGAKIGMGIKVINLGNNVLTATAKPVTCHGAYQNGYNEPIGEPAYGGVTLTGGTGDGGYARKDKNPDPQLVDIKMISGVAYIMAIGQFRLYLKVPVNSKVAETIQLWKEAAIQTEENVELMKYLSGEKPEPSEEKDEATTSKTSATPENTDQVKVKQVYEGMKPGTIVFWETDYPGSKKGIRAKVITDSTGEIYPGNKPATDTIKYKW